MQKRKEKRKEKRAALEKIPTKKWLILMAGVIILCGLFYIIGNLRKEKSSELMAQMESYHGYTRVVSGEEQDFYTYFVKREMGITVSEEEMDVLVEDYINKANAVFFLGNKLGLCEPYSFDLLKLRMEQENRSRQLKKEQGEVIYGVEQFTLQTFYQYERDTIESDIIAYLEANMDQGILNLAEKYYKDHEEFFIGREAVVYEVTEHGVTELIEADRSQMDFLGNADRALADFLESAEIGDLYEDTESGSDRSVVLKEIRYTQGGFNNNRDYVITYYIRNVLLDEVLDMVAENNPVELS